jgi:acyl-coenzyme A thioesterase PaaI-like protein
MDAPDGFAPFDPLGPFLEVVGPVLVREGHDGPVFGLRVEARHTNHRGTVQGALLSTFVDFALGRAIEADAGDGKDRATVSLTVDFSSPPSQATGSRPARAWSASAAHSPSPTAR